MSTSRNQSNGCLGIFLSVLGIGQSGREARHAQQLQKSEEGEKLPKQFPYRVRDDFMSDPEKSFYRVLKQVVADRAIIFTKIGLEDIFYVARPHENREAKQHIDRKHVDFLLCDLTTLQPILGIELDDSSHDKPDQKKKDTTKDAVFETAKLPLLRIPTGHGYNTNDLGAKLAPYIGSSVKPEPTKRNVPPASVQVSADGVPLCPKCGTPMVIRVAGKGEHQGEKFYACPNFPRCKSYIPVR